MKENAPPHDAQWLRKEQECRNPHVERAAKLSGGPQIVPSAIENAVNRGVQLNKRAAPLVREKCDIVAFLNYRISIKEKEVAPKTKVAHAEGGKERQIHLSRGAGFDAKNRYFMPDAITYRKGSGYADLSKFWLGQPANDNAASSAAA